MHEFSTRYSVWVFLAFAVLLLSVLLPVAFKIMTYLDNRKEKTPDGVLTEKRNSEC